MDNATKRPWRHTGTSCSKLNFCSRWITGPDLSGQPAIAVGETATEAEANANLIVKAVNCHDKLLEALKDIASSGCCRTPGCCTEDPMCQAMIAQQAIDQAEAL